MGLLSTYNLTQGVSPDSILVITFTNKAAEELRQRLVEMGLPKVPPFKYSVFVHKSTLSTVI
jgi:superfamily I DNA/RNA helicase